MTRKHALAVVADIREYVKRNRNLAARDSNHNQKTQTYLSDLDKLARLLRKD